MARLFVNIRKESKDKARRCGRCHAGETGMPGGLIGTIDISVNSHSWKRLKIAENVLSSMKNNQIKGKNQYRTLPVI